MTQADAYRTELTDVSTLTLAEKDYATASKPQTADHTMIVQHTHPHTRFPARKKTSIHSHMSTVHRLPARHLRLPLLGCRSVPATAPRRLCMRQRVYITLLTVGRTAAALERAVQHRI